jgi:uncharacterized damage-inducible protein DinB
MNLQDAWKFHQWATIRALETCEILSPEEFTKDLGNSFASVRDTLVHCLFADGIWFHRIQQLPFTRPNPSDFSSSQDVKAAWQPISERWTDLIEQTKPEQRITYTALDGQAFESDFEEITRHVVNHGTYHRGQIMMMLKLLGHKAIATDWLLVAYRAVKRSKLLSRSQPQ